jgi:hypothetical protein
MATKAGVEKGVFTTVMSSVIDAGDDDSPCPISTASY